MHGAKRDRRNADRGGQVRSRGGVSLLHIMPRELGAVQREAGLRELKAGDSPALTCVSSRLRASSCSAISAESRAPFSSAGEHVEQRGAHFRSRRPRSVGDSELRGLGQRPRGGHTMTALAGRLDGHVERGRHDPRRDAARGGIVAGRKGEHWIGRWPGVVRGRLLRCGTGNGRHSP